MEITGWPWVVVVMSAVLEGLMSAEPPSVGTGNQSGQKGGFLCRGGGHQGPLCLTLSLLANWCRDVCAHLCMEGNPLSTAASPEGGAALSGRCHALGRVLRGPLFPQLQDMRRGFRETLKLAFGVALAFIWNL